MKINIQNYETYFLLYIDKALSAADCSEVEIFIQENPALAKELTQLKQTVLTPEHIAFDNKALLYRYDEMDASLTNSFKQSLYREEAKVVNIFFTRTQKIGMASIAALFLLIIGYKFYFNPPIEVKNIVSNSNSQQTKINETLAATSINTPKLIENNIIFKSKNEATSKTDGKLFTSKNEAVAKENNFIQQASTTVNNLNSAPEMNNTIVTENSSLTISDNTSASNTENETVILNNNNNNTSINEADTYNNINTEEHDRSIYIANFEIDGEKLRGVTRRINAIFKRNKNEKQK
jgi:hypothetical protein